MNKMNTCTIFEPHHEKIFFYHMQLTKVQISLGIRSVFPGRTCHFVERRLTSVTQDIYTFQSKIEHEPVTGKTEEEVRVSSAKSRASLRKEFKNRLEETRNIVEDRRANTPAISLPSQKSLDEDQLIVDDDDDDMPIPDDMKG